MDGPRRRGKGKRPPKGLFGANLPWVCGAIAQGRRFAWRLDVQARSVPSLGMDPPGLDLDDRQDKEASTCAWQEPKQRPPSADSCVVEGEGIMETAVRDSVDTHRPRRAPGVPWHVSNPVCSSFLDVASKSHVLSSDISTSTIHPSDAPQVAVHDGCAFVHVLPTLAHRSPSAHQSRARNNSSTNGRGGTTGPGDGPGSEDADT